MLNIFRRKREKFDYSFVQVNSTLTSVDKDSAHLTRISPSISVTDNNNDTAAKRKSVQFTKLQDVQSSYQHPRNASWQSETQVNAEVHRTPRNAPEDDPSGLEVDAGQRKYHNELSASLQALSSNVQGAASHSNSGSHTATPKHAPQAAQSSSSSASSIDTLSNANLSRKFTDSQISLASAATHQNAMTTAIQPAAHATLQRTGISNEALENPRNTTGANFKPAANHVSFAGSPTHCATAAKNRIIKAHSLYNLPHEQCESVIGASRTAARDTMHLHVPGSMLKQSNSMIFRLIAGAQSLSALDSNVDSASTATVVLPDFAAASANNADAGAHTSSGGADSMWQHEPETQHTSRHSTGIELLHGEISQVQRRIERIKRELDASRSKTFQQRLNRERVRLAHAATPSQADQTNASPTPEQEQEQTQTQQANVNVEAGAESYLDRVEQLRTRLKGYQFVVSSAPQPLAPDAQWQSRSSTANSSSSSSQNSVAAASNMQQLVAHAAQLPATIASLQERLLAFDAQLRDVADVNVSERLAICAHKDKIVCTLENLRSKLTDSEPQRITVEAQIRQLEREIASNRHVADHKLRLQADREQVAAQLDEAIRLQAQIQTLLGAAPRPDQLMSVPSVLTRSQHPVLLASRVGVAHVAVPVPANSAPALANAADPLTSRLSVFRPANSTCELQMCAAQPPSYPQHLATERLRRQNENIYINDASASLQDNQFATSVCMPQTALRTLHPHPRQPVFAMPSLLFSGQLQSNPRSPTVGPFAMTPSLTAAQTHIVTTPSPATFYASGQPVTAGAGAAHTQLLATASPFDIPTRAVALPLNASGNATIALRRGLVDADSAISIADVDVRPKVAQLAVRFDFRKRDEQLTIRVDSVLNPHVLLHSLHADGDDGNSNAAQCDQCSTADCATDVDYQARRRYAMCVKAVLIPGLPYINLHTRYVEVPGDTSLPLPSTATRNGQPLRTGSQQGFANSRNAAPLRNSEPNLPDSIRRPVDFHDVFIVTVPCGELFTKTTHFSFWLQETTVSGQGRAVNSEQCVGYTLFSMSTLLSDDAADLCQNAALLNVVQLDRLDYGTFPWLPLPQPQNTNTNTPQSSSSVAERRRSYSNKNYAEPPANVRIKPDRLTAAVAESLERLGVAGAGAGTDRQFAHSASQTGESTRQPMRSVPLAGEQLADEAPLPLHSVHASEGLHEVECCDVEPSSSQRSAKDKQAIITQYLTKVRASNGAAHMQAQAAAAAAGDSSRGKCSEEIEECC